MFGTPTTTLWTVGHSTRTFEAFLALLRENRIEVLADVRHFPASERVPWTNGPRLREAVEGAGITYDSFVDLGGYRKPARDSANTGWRSEGFRGYADYMATDAFQQALQRLLALAASRRTAVMCAEAVPWKCHRSLLSDAVVARGLRVVHILGTGSLQDHRLTSFAKVREGHVAYPAPGPKGLKRARR